MTGTTWGTARTGLVALVMVTLGACTLPRWPVDGTMTSPYGFRWVGGPDLHRGVDISVPVGTPVYAMKPGQVRFAGTQSGYGNVVWVDHGRDVLSVYAHLSQIDVREGQRVDRSAPIGLSGRSGNASGPHLHFEVWRNGREIDPVEALGGFPKPATPGP